MKGIGQNFDDFMIEQGLYEEAKELAAKRLIALQLEEEMNKTAHLKIRNGRKNAHFTHCRGQCA